MLNGTKYAIFKNEDTFSDEILESPWTDQGIGELEGGIHGVRFNNKGS